MVSFPHAANAMPLYGRLFSPELLIESFIQDSCPLPPGLSVLDLPFLWSVLDPQIAFRSESNLSLRFDCVDFQMFSLGWRLVQKTLPIKFYRFYSVVICTIIHKGHIYFLKIRIELHIRLKIVSEWWALRKRDDLFISDEVPSGDTLFSTDPKMHGESCLLWEGQSLVVVWTISFSTPCIYLCVCLYLYT